MCNSLSIISLSLGHLFEVANMDQKVAKLQANYAETVAHLL